MATEIARLDAILGADISQFERAMKKADDSVVKFSNISKQFEALKPFSPYIIQGAQAAKTLVQLKDLLAQLKIEQQAAFNPKELVAYNAAIKSVNAEIKRLETGKAAASGAGKALNSAFSSVKNLAYLIPGLGIAGIFDLAFTAISKAAEGMNLFGTTTKEAKEQMEELAKASAKAETEAVGLRSLLKVAQDVNQSDATRLNAIKELQKEYPGYLSNINLENINSQEAKNAINSLTDAIQRKAKMQALSNLLTKAEETLYNSQNATISDNIVSFKALLGLFKGGALGAGGTAGAIGGAFEKTAEDISDAQKRVDELTKSMEELTLSQSQNSDYSLLNPETPKKLKKVAEEFARINAFIKGRGKFDKLITIETGDNVTAEIQKELDKGPSLRIPPFSTEGIKSRSKEMAETIRQTLESALEGVGESIGNLLSGQKNPFSNIFNIIGEGLKALGKQLIIVGELGELVQKALATIFTTPALAIAAGIAAIALGTAIANLGGGIKQHAEGGIFTQPTQIGGHLFGEKEPEALIPLSRLGNMNSSGNNIQVSGRLIADGNQLVAVINATNRQNSRTYGSNFNRSNGI